MLPNWFSLINHRVPDEYHDISANWLSVNPDVNILVVLCVFPLCIVCYSEHTVEAGEDRWQHKRHTCFISVCTRETRRECTESRGSIIIRGKAYTQMYLNYTLIKKSYVRFFLEISGAAGLCSSPIIPLLISSFRDF